MIYKVKEKDLENTLYPKESVTDIENLSSISRSLSLLIIKHKNSYFLKYKTTPHYCYISIDLYDILIGTPFFNSILSSDCETVGYIQGIPICLNLNLNKSQIFFCENKIDIEKYKRKEKIIKIKNNVSIQT